MEEISWTYQRYEEQLVAEVIGIYVGSVMVKQNVLSRHLVSLNASLPGLAKLVRVQPNVNNAQWYFVITLAATLGWS